MGKSGTIMLHIPPHGMCAVALVIAPPYARVIAITPAPRCTFWVTYLRAPARGEPIVSATERPVSAAEVPGAVASLAPGVDWSEADWTLDPHRPTDHNVWATALAQFRPA